ncbi:transcriptional regulator [Salmonella enterica subsp. enterica serovar Braenderup]|nr:transcriptional regulator [Salmonella enterica subsp. enterica serovar Braenderup]ECD3088232.1 transcriptional regulator [Salmonella enterica subsp. enterica serovar Braenderup]
MTNELHRWRKAATTDEWTKLAKLANTTPGYLDQIAYGNRRASPEMASAIENATKNFHHQAPVLKESLVFASPRDAAA